jgi:hypothetical protein
MELIFDYTNERFVIPLTHRFQERVGLSLLVVGPGKEDY